MVNYHHALLCILAFAFFRPDAKASTVSISGFTSASVCDTECNTGVPGFFTKDYDGPYTGLSLSEQSLSDSSTLQSSGVASSLANVNYGEASNQVTFVVSSVGSTNPKVDLVATASAGWTDRINFLATGQYQFIFNLNCFHTLPTCDAGDGAAGFTVMIGNHSFNSSVQSASLNFTAGDSVPFSAAVVTEYSDSGFFDKQFVPNLIDFGFDLRVLIEPDFTIGPDALSDSLDAQQGSSNPYFTTESGFSYQDSGVSTPEPSTVLMCLTSCLGALVMRPCIWWWCAKRGRACIGKSNALVSL
jgi:hypothetical protein